MPDYRVSLVSGSKSLLSVQGDKIKSSKGKDSKIHVKEQKLRPREEQDYGR